MTKFLGVLKGDVSVAEVPTVNPDQGGKKKRRNYFSVLRMKGDVEGHPFRGNQWTDGSGGGDSSGEVGQRWNPPKDARSVAESGEVKVFSYGFDGEGSALTVVRGDKVIATGFSDDGGPAVNQPFVNGKSQGVKSFDSVKDMAEHFASLHSAKANPGKVSSKLNSLSSKLHDKIPLQDAFDAAEANGYEPVQEDGTRWQGILTGREGRAEIDLKDRKSGKIANRMQIQWYRHENTGRYEFNAYLSGNPSRKGEYSSILKGDYEGHPFRGNQYTEGTGEGGGRGWGGAVEEIDYSKVRLPEDRDAEKERIRSTMERYNNGQMLQNVLQEGARREAAGSKAKDYTTPPPKFMYNGIKDPSTGKLHRVWYSEQAYDSEELLKNGKGDPKGTISIYAKDYSSLPKSVQERFTVRNDTDIQTDYFETDTVRVRPDHPLYGEVKAALNKQSDHRGRVIMNRQTRQAVPGLRKKGDVPGHEFRGNQYTSGGGGRDDFTLSGRPPNTGDKVNFGHQGRMESGKVVRVERRPGDGGSPFAVVDIGRYESVKVPLHQIKGVSRANERWDDPEGPANTRPYEHGFDED